VELLGSQIAGLKPGVTGLAVPMALGYCMMLNPSSFLNSEMP
jgi:hypothetical protein